MKRKEQSLGRFALAFILLWATFTCISAALKMRLQSEYEQCVQQTSVSDTDCEECYLKTYGRLPDKK